MQNGLAEMKGVKVGNTIIQICYGLQVSSFSYKNFSLNMTSTAFWWGAIYVTNLQRI